MKGNYNKKRNDRKKKKASFCVVTIKEHIACFSIYGL
jgi:hypothetical protein